MPQPIAYAQGVCYTTSMSEETKKKLYLYLAGYVAALAGASAISLIGENLIGLTAVIVIGGVIPVLLYKNDK